MGGNTHDSRRPRAPLASELTIHHNQLIVTLGAGFAYVVVQETKCFYGF